VIATNPGLFTFSGNGQGIASGLVFDVPPTGAPETRYLAICSGGICTPNPVVMSSSHTYYLELFGTGIQNAKSDQVSATINGVKIPVMFFGQQAQFPGLDQINLGPLPISLAGSGSVNLILTVNGVAANTVTATFQ
jgi:uncharacterized protein (TIGR03437 family)